MALSGSHVARHDDFLAVPVLPARARLERFWNSGLCVSALPGSAQPQYRAQANDAC